MNFGGGGVVSLPLSILAVVNLELTYHFTLLTSGAWLAGLTDCKFKSDVFSCALEIFRTVRLRGIEILIVSPRPSGSGSFLLWPVQKGESGLPTRGSLVSVES